MSPKLREEREGVALPIKYVHAYVYVIDFEVRLKKSVHLSV